MLFLRAGLPGARLLHFNNFTLCSGFKSVFFFSNQQQQQCGAPLIPCKRKPTSLTVAALSCASSSSSSSSCASFCCCCCSPCSPCSSRGNVLGLGFEGWGGFLNSVRILKGVACEEERRLRLRNGGGVGARLHVIAGALKERDEERVGGEGGEEWWRPPPIQPSGGPSPRDQRGGGEENFGRSSYGGEGGNSSSSSSSRGRGGGVGRGRGGRGGRGHGEWIESNGVSTRGFERGRGGGGGGGAWRGRGDGAASNGGGMGGFERGRGRGRGSRGARGGGGGRGSFSEVRSERFAGSEMSDGPRGYGENSSSQFSNARGRGRGGGLRGRGGRDSFGGDQRGRAPAGRSGESNFRDSRDSFRPPGSRFSESSFGDSRDRRFSNSGDAFSEGQDRTPSSRFGETNSRGSRDSFRNSRESFGDQGGRAPSSRFGESNFGEERDSFRSSRESFSDRGGRAPSSRFGERDFRDSRDSFRSSRESFSDRGGRAPSSRFGEKDFRDSRDSFRNSRVSQDSYSESSSSHSRYNNRDGDSYGTSSSILDRKGDDDHYNKSAQGWGNSRGSYQPAPENGRGRRETYRGGRGGRGGRGLPGHRSVKRAEGEEKWQFMVRKKKVRQPRVGPSAGKAENFGDDNDDDNNDNDEVDSEEEDSEEEGLDAPAVDDGEPEDAKFVPSNEVWRRKKIGWLCKELPGLKPAGIVTILNSQRPWITAVDTKQIIDHLLRTDQVLRAHRVLKWMMQQPWYENDFDLNTKLANILGRKGKLTRMREMFDTIIQNGRPPVAATYTILIGAYIEDGTAESLDEAYAIFNQMAQLGAHEQPPQLACSLFEAFCDRQGGANLRHLHQADPLFENMLKHRGKWGSRISPETWTRMYLSLIHLHGVHGNGPRVEGLIEEMRTSGLEVPPNVYTSVIRVCSKDGNVERAEQVFEELLRSGHKPEWRAYVALIQTYGMAGMPAKALQTFKDMEAAEMRINFTIYEAVIEALAKAGEKESAEALLEKALVEFAPHLQASYNALMEMYEDKDLLGEIEIRFHEMKEKGCRPNHQSYNLLVDSYIKRGLLDKAEGVYNEMREEGGIRPNVKTYSLMIEAFSKAERQEKVKEVYTSLTARKFELPAHLKPLVTEAVGPKKVAYEEKSRPRKLVQEQREMLVGVLLGGARLESHDNDRTYEFHFGLNSDTHVGPIMINHLHKTFADWAQQEPRVEIVEDPSEASKQDHLVQFATVSHGSFRFYAHQYRPEGQPVIPRLVHRWLTPRSLAYWYMYGGSKCEATGAIILNASHYTPKELELVAKALKARTIDCERKKQRSGYIVRFRGQSAMWLWKLMEPHILEELRELLKPEDRDLRGVQDDKHNNGDISDIVNTRHVNKGAESADPISSDLSVSVEDNSLNKEEKDSVVLQEEYLGSHVSEANDDWEGLGEAVLREKNGSSVSRHPRDSKVSQKVEMKDYETMRSSHF